MTKFVSPSGFKDVVLSFNLLQLHAAARGNMHCLTEQFDKKNGFKIYILERKSQFSKKS